MTQEQATAPTPEVQVKIKSNTWDHFGDILPTLEAISRGDWYWGANSRCKYIEIRIDTRDGGCILSDSNGVRISPEQLAHQSHSVGRMGGWAHQIAAAPQAAPAVDAARIDFLCNTSQLRFIEHTGGFWRMYQDEATPDAELHDWKAMTSEWHATPRAAIDAALAQESKS